MSDTKLVSLFREWLAAERALVAMETPDGDPEFEAAFNRDVELEYEIARTPATGAEGLAVKIYMLQHLKAIEARADPCALDPLDAYTLGGCVDAVRALPELAPLAAAIVGEPNAVIGFGEPDDKRLA
jgi:hypothetical protein